MVLSLCPCQIPLTNHHTVSKRICSLWNVVSNKFLFYQSFSYLKLLFNAFLVPGRGVFSYYPEDWVPVLWDNCAFSDWSQDLDPPSASTLTLGDTLDIEGLLPRITERVQIQAAQRHQHCINLLTWTAHVTANTDTEKLSITILLTCVSGTSST